MTSGLGDLVISLRADATGFAADLKKSQRTLGGFVKSSVSNLAQIGLAANTLKMAFSALIGPMQEAQEAALAERKLAQVFKSTSEAAGIAKDQVVAYAKARQDITSFDADDTVNAAALLGSFTNVRGDVFMQALDSAQDLSAFMGEDLESSIMKIGKALNDPAKGVSALAKSGIQFSASQKEQIKTLTETGQVAKAQSIILKELQTQFGGQAEALVDPIKQAANAWGDFMETIGTIANEKLLPLMPKLIEGFKALSEMAELAIDAIAQIDAKLNTKSMDLSGYEKFNLALAGLLTGQSPEDMAAAVKDMRQGGLGAGTAKKQIGAMKPDTPLNIAPPLKWSVDPSRGPQTLSELFDKEQRDKLKHQAPGVQFGAENFMAGLIRDGLSAMQSGVMSLGPMEKGFEGNKVGSLEKNSQEAFEVLRANVGAGDKDKVQEKQLSELQKLNKNTEKILVNSKLSNRQKMELILGMDL
jgi:hypothetical protein